MKKIIIVLGTITILYYATTLLVPPYIETQRNPVKSAPPYSVSSEAQAIYDRLDFISDLHCDALLWGRDLTKRGSRGQVDFPRMREASVALEMFTIVTKSPAGQNMQSNTTNAFDNITPLTIAKGESPANWFSLINRTLTQSENLANFIEGENGQAILIKTKTDLNKLIAARKNDKSVIGGMLGIEGAHALEGEIENLDRVYAAGVRMIGLTHFFDNELGGSAHGQSQAGLTEFERSVVKKMNELGIFVDLAHCSAAIIDDVLEITNMPVMVSHTGVRGVLDSQRNLSDNHIQKIAKNGGIIGIAFFDEAVGVPELPNIIASIKHIRDLVGVEYVALGSDYDGSVAVPFDITGFPFLVEGMMNAGFSQDEIKAVMGENVKRFLLQNLK
ncbi:microsomal dipeptidase-like Zn-dependent dipeptidase [Algoriphagus ratkowskyi]|uniref:Microsomal dipeptidase-like Zn-dependent dipeptidase n=1 Tax=Algoriphagus ratkowskyi TaxID=57028 RepID=A0A2W7R672_9BACT|nr:dipeptidase [Algoriphagus ratkowskyi]PZX55964.1 microsomal dipeptidase-like Zn-dependent dipeptidase [Algoriphagus ratkowskyi]TXD77223.1 peptidase M19 [Algoriphagus ratkowskyi]